MLVITGLANASEQEIPAIEPTRALERKQPQAKQEPLSIENLHHNTKAISSESIELINQMNTLIDPNGLIQGLETIKKVAQRENATQSVTEINNLIENMQQAIKLNEVCRNKLRSEIYMYLLKLTDFSDRDFGRK